MATWADIQRGIFAGESGGDYGALFNYQNRPDGRFSNIDLTQMSVDDALQFADPSGPYAQYVKGQVGRVATPMGAYQVVGKTLRAAKEGLGLTGNERMTPELQDRIGQWIYKEQGTGAWEGYKGPRVSTREGSTMDGNNMNDQAMGALNAMQEQDSGDKYKDIAGNLALAFNSMRLNPDPTIAATIKDIRTARTEKQAKNKTLAYLEKIGRGDLVSAINAGLSPREAIAQMFNEAAELRGFERQKELATFKAGLEAPRDDRTASMREFELAQADPNFAKFLGLKNPPESPEGLKALDKQFATSLGEGGGSQNLAAAMSDAASVKTVLDKLEAGEPLTGPLIGSLPVELRAFISPEGVQAQQLVESVVQKNLRAILGGQFAQKEGEQLVRRAYNPQLTPAQNAARLRPLFKSLEAAAKNKAAMTEYFFNNNYSLGGYEGPVGVPSISSFMSALESADASSAQPAATQSAGVPQVGAIEQGYRFKGGDPSLETSWEKVD